MASILERSLLVVTGKGGVGKTTLAAALGVAAARRGLRTVVVEVGEHSRLADLFGASNGQPPGGEVALRANLWAATIDPDRVLLEWVQELGGRIPGRVLTSSGTFQYFAAAAPGAKELFTMVKIWELTQQRRWKRRAEGYDLVVLDAPATGHALGMLRSPQTFGAIARVGPVATQAERVGELLADPARSSYVAVALASEMAVTETIELQQGLREQLGRELARVIVNALLPRRFTSAELARIAALDGKTPSRRRAPTEATSMGASVTRPPARRSPCTSGRRLSTTSSPGCAVATSTWWACRSCGTPASTSQRSRRSPSISIVGCRRRDASADAEPVEQGLVGAPVATHAHRQFEVDLASEDTLELAPGCGADRLDHPPLGADHDPLLGLGLDPDQRPNPGQSRSRGRRSPRRAPRPRAGAPGRSCRMTRLADQLGEQQLASLVGAWRPWGT